MESMPMSMQSPCCLSGVLNYVFIRALLSEFFAAPSYKSRMTNISTASQSHFLNLPAEVRTEIYSLFYQPLVQHGKHKARLVCEDARHSLDASIRVTSAWDIQGPSTMLSQLQVKDFFPLLLVCRLIHHETSPMWY